MKRRGSAPPPSRNRTQRRTGWRPAAGRASTWRSCGCVPCRQTIRIHRLAGDVEDDGEEALRYPSPRIPLRAQAKPADSVGVDADDGVVAQIDGRTTLPAEGIVRVAQLVRLRILDLSRHRPHLTVRLVPWVTADGGRHPIVGLSLPTKSEPSCGIADASVQLHHTPILPGVTGASVIHVRPQLSGGRESVRTNVAVSAGEELQIRVPRLPTPVVEAVARRDERVGGNHPAAAVVPVVLRYVDDRPVGVSGRRVDACALVGRNHAVGGVASPLHRIESGGIPRIRAERGIFAQLEIGQAVAVRVDARGVDLFRGRRGAVGCGWGCGGSRRARPRVGLSGGAEGKGQADGCDRRQSDVAECS